MSYSETYYTCRAEINSKAQQIVLEDGSTYTYSSLIYCPLDVPDIPCGTKILVLDGTVTRIEGIVKGFSRGQFNCRIWV